MAAIRAFVAAPLSVALNAAFDQLIEGFDPLWPNTRWVPTDQRHLTLKFLGQIESEPLRMLAAEVQDVLRSLGRFSVTVTHIGPFPANARSHIVAAHLAKPDELQKLADGLDSLAASVGLRRRRRAFRPHVTLGRLQHRPDTGEAVLTEPFTGTLEIAAVEICRSDQSEHGNRYTVLDHFNIAA